MTRKYFCRKELWFVVGMPKFMLKLIDSFNIW